MLERIMIVDWMCIWHGRRTRSTLPGVLFSSLQPAKLVSEAGRRELEQVGTGTGAGYTVNIPLTAGTGDRGYRAAVRAVSYSYRYSICPQLIIITAGQDGSARSSCQMTLTMGGFRKMSN